jgi:hypothetical protein
MSRWDRRGRISRIGWRASRHVPGWGSGRSISWLKAAPFKARNMRWLHLSRALIAVRNELATDPGRETGVASRRAPGLDPQLDRGDGGGRCSSGSRIGDGICRDRGAGSRLVVVAVDGGNGVERALAGSLTQARQSGAILGRRGGRRGWVFVRRAIQNGSKSFVDLRAKRVRVATGDGASLIRL